MPKAAARAGGSVAVSRKLSSKMGEPQEGQSIEILNWLFTHDTRHMHMCSYYVWLHTSYSFAQIRFDTWTCLSRCSMFKNTLTSTCTSLYLNAHGSDLPRQQKRGPKNVHIASPARLAAASTATNQLSWAAAFRSASKAAHR